MGVWVRVPLIAPEFMKIKYDCPYCGVINTKRNLLAYAGEESPHKHYVFKCWNCKKGFTVFDDKIDKWTDFLDPI